MTTDLEPIACYGLGEESTMYVYLNEQGKYLVTETPQYGGEESIVGVFESLEEAEMKMKELV
jgi:hypothetical protein